MQSIEELISRYGLEERTEYVIIPFVTATGRPRRIFLLKRRLIIVIDEEGNYSDHSLADVIEASVRNPELPLVKALRMLKAERAVHEEHLAEAPEQQALPGRLSGQ